MGAQMSIITAQLYHIMKVRGCLWLCVIFWPLSLHSSAAGQECDSPLWSRQPWPLTPAQAGLGCRNVLAVGMGCSVLSRSAQRDSMYRVQNTTDSEHLLAVQLLTRSWCQIVLWYKWIFTLTMLIMISKLVFPCFPVKYPVKVPLKLGKWMN